MDAGSTAVLPFVSLKQCLYRNHALTLLTFRFQIPEEIDEFIRVDCPDMPLGVSRTFNVRRSALMRSPVLASFFASLDYLPGCKMGLHFMNDPGVCFEVVQTYLENGPDCYPMLRLKVYITRLTKNADRFLVLLRLHKLATELELIHLKNMALEVIHDLEWEMSAECCPKIAQLVFARQSPYDDTIKLWALKHIGHFYRKLSRSSTWASLVPILDAELGQHWTTMQASGICVLSMIAEEATDAAVSDVLAGFPLTARYSAVSAVKGSSTSCSPTQSEASTQTCPSLIELRSQSELSMSSQDPKVEKPTEVTPRGKKKKRSRTLTNCNQFVVGMHKEWVITCTPSKQSKPSPISSKSTSPTTSKTQTGVSAQPSITVSQFDDDSSTGSDHKITLDIKSVEEKNEVLRRQQEQDDNEWEDEEEEVAIQEAIRAFGTTPRNDSKAREVLGLTERFASIDGPLRPQDENAKARRVLGINDDGGGFIAGRKETRMMRVKKSLTKFNDFLNP